MDEFLLENTCFHKINKSDSIEVLMHNYDQEKKKKNNETTHLPQGN